MSVRYENVPTISVSSSANPGDAFVTVKNGGKNCPELSTGNLTLEVLRAWEDAVNDFGEQNNIKPKELASRAVRGIKSRTIANWARNDADNIKNMTISTFVQAVRDTHMPIGWDVEHERLLRGLRMKEEEAFARFVDRVHDLNDMLEGNGRHWTDTQVRIHVAANLSTKLQRACDLEKNRAELLAVAIDDYDGWHKKMLVIDAQRLVDERAFAEQVQAQMSTMLADRTNKRTYSDRADRAADDRNVKKPRTISSSSSSSSSAAAPFANTGLPSSHTPGQGTYRGKDRCDPLKDNERVNVVALGGCTHCREVFCYHKTCNVWPVAEDYVLVDDKRRAELLAALTPMQRTKHDAWVRANTDDIARRSAPPPPKPVADAAPKPTNKGKGKAVAAVAPVEMHRFEELYDSEDSEDDVATRNT